MPCIRTHLFFFLPFVFSVSDCVCSFHLALALALVCCACCRHSDGTATLRIRSRLSPPTGTVADEPEEWLDRALPDPSGSTRGGGGAAPPQPRLPAELQAAREQGSDGGGIDGVGGDRRSSAVTTAALADLAAHGRPSRPLRYTSRVYALQPAHAPPLPTPTPTQAAAPSCAWARVGALGLELESWLVEEEGGDGAGCWCSVTLVGDHSLAVRDGARALLDGGIVLDGDDATAAAGAATTAGTLPAVLYRGGFAQWAAAAAGEASAPGAASVSHGHQTGSRPLCVSPPSCPASSAKAVPPPMPASAASVPVSTAPLTSAPIPIHRSNWTSHDIELAAREDGGTPSCCSEALGSPAPYSIADYRDSPAAGGGEPHQQHHRQEQSGDKAQLWPTAAAGSRSVDHRRRRFLASLSRSLSPETTLLDSSFTDCGGSSTAPSEHASTGGGGTEEGVEGEDDEAMQQMVHHFSRSLPSRFSRANREEVAHAGVAAGSSSDVRGGVLLEPPPAPRCRPASPRFLPPKLMLPPRSPGSSPLSSSGVSMMMGSSPPTPPAYVQVGFHVGSPASPAEMTIHAVLARDPGALAFEAQQRRHRMHAQREAQQPQHAHAHHGHHGHHHYGSGGGSKVRTMARSR